MPYRSSEVPTGSSEVVAPNESQAPFCRVLTGYIPRQFLARAFAKKSVLVALPMSWSQESHDASSARITDWLNKDGATSVEINVRTDIGNRAPSASRRRIEGAPAVASDLARPDLVPTLARRRTPILRLHVFAGTVAGIVLCALLGITGCRPSDARSPPPGAESPPDQGAELRVTQGPLVGRHLMTGELFAEQAAELIAPNVGQWPIQIRKLVENGIRVETGEPVVEFDNSNQVGNLDQQRTAVVTAETQLLSTQATAAASVQEAEFERLRRQSEFEKASLKADIPSGLQSELEEERLRLEKSRAALELREALTDLESKKRSAESDIELKRIDLRKARLAVQRVEQDLELLSLRAPRAGLVEIGENRDEDRTLQAGDSVQPGSTVARIPDLSSLAVRARLFDVDDSRIATGLEATVTLDAFPDLAYSARIRSIQQLAQQMSRRSRRRSFDVVLDLEEIDLERMRTGMSVKISVDTIYNSQVAGRPDGDSAASEPLLAPRVALDLDHPEGPRAAMARGGFRSVSVGECSTSHCVIEDGLSLGQELRPIGLRDDVPVVVARSSHRAVPAAAGNERASNP